MQFWRTRAFVYALAAVAVGLMLLAGKMIARGPERFGPVDMVKMDPATPVPSTPLVGGPFTLTDHGGKTVSDADFRGQYMLVYFGYIFCPDVCPTSLQLITDALNELGPLADKVVPVFITIDPERDTVEAMRDYVAHFHPRTVGLTGPVEAIEKVAKAYRVYYAKVTGKSGNNPDYLVDHTAITYLMGPDGKFVHHFAHGAELPKVIEQLKDKLAVK